jgi:hypothetical protein
MLPSELFLVRWMYANSKMNLYYSTINEFGEYKNLHNILRIKYITKTTFH